MRHLSMARNQTAGTGRTEIRRVHVTYAPEGAGLSLVDVDTPTSYLDAAAESASGETASGESDGVLHISEACITLEIPRPDGQPSVLAWDPAEVSWDSLGLSESA